MKPTSWLRKILLPAIATILASGALAAGSGLISYGNRLTAVEVKVEDLQPHLQRIEEKVDQLLLRNSR